MNPPVELVPTQNMVESLRQIKSEDEIQRTTNALRLAEKAFLEVLDAIRPDMTEKQAAWALEKAMREAGAQSLSFPVIVASGPNSALPHAVPTDRRLALGEPILFDWGARLDEYCSDTTRTVVMGKPDERFKKVFDTVVMAQGFGHRRHQGRRQRYPGGQDRPGPYRSKRLCGTVRPQPGSRYRIGGP
jgi:Xaa-Pro aminopeptidase